MACGSSSNATVLFNNEPTKRASHLIVVFFSKIPSENLPESEREQLQLLRALADTLTHVFFDNFLHNSNSVSVVHCTASLSVTRYSLKNTLWSDQHCALSTSKVIEN